MSYLHRSLLFHGLPDGVRTVLKRYKIRERSFVLPISMLNLCGNISALRNEDNIVIGINKKTPPAAGKNNSRRHAFLY